jgi:release factor glutamine methyltransferase
MDHPRLTLREVLAKSTTYLQQKQVDSPRLSAEIVVAHALGMQRIDLFLDMDRPLLDSDLDTIRPLLMRRGAGEPVAYILGSKEFYSLDFSITPDVLIPRPETELGIDLVLKHHARAEPLRFADVGTGSGILGVTLLHLFPQAACIATDISRKALLVARDNARRHGVAHRALFTQADLLHHANHSSLDLIIANLPYISSAEMQGLDPEVGAFEPRLALYGGPAGDELFMPLVRCAMHALKPEGKLLMEVGAAQAGILAGRIREMDAGWTRISVIKDLAGAERFVCAILRRNEA